MFWRTWHVREGSSWRTIRISKEYDCKSWSEQAARPVLFISESFIALFSAISFLETSYERFIALHLSHLCRLCPLTLSCLFSLSRLNSSELIFHLWSLSVSDIFDYTVIQGPALLKIRDPDSSFICTPWSQPLGSFPALGVWIPAWVNQWAPSCLEGKVDKTINETQCWKVGYCIRWKLGMDTWEPSWAAEGYLEGCSQ